jgi:branched-chain amino acid transport system permease protein
MEFFNANLPYILAGISVGGQYALIAIGYTMVYGILRLINFAHGDIFMAAGFMMVYLSASMPLYISIPLTIIITVLLGFVIERVAYRPLRSAPRMSVMISAIGVSYLLQNCAWYITSGLAKQYPVIPWISDSVTVFSATTLLLTSRSRVLDICASTLSIKFSISSIEIGRFSHALSTPFSNFSRL